ncbi:hypothetical protein QBC39DRAFT_387054 [Podospora conica]|nr:hypothetical protein QBC39DRAFT_387054 [Schizothecium conicum]
MSASAQTSRYVNVNRIPLSLRKVKLGDLVQEVHNRIPLSLRKVKLGDLVQEVHNRIPLSLRRVKLGDLAHSWTPGVYADQQQRSQKAAAKGPPVPEKDINHGRPPLRKPPVAYPGSPMRAGKRTSHGTTGGDKEDDVEGLDMPKKKARPGQATAASEIRLPRKTLHPGRP